MSNKNMVEVTDHVVIVTPDRELLVNEQGSILAVVDHITPESQSVDVQKMLDEETAALESGAEDLNQLRADLDMAPSASKKKARVKRQAVMPEGYNVEAGHWERIFQAMKRGYTLKALVVAIDYPDDKPAWMLTFKDYPDIRGVVPAGETDLDDYRLMSFFVGLPIDVKIKGLDRANYLVGCSRREAVAEARARLYEEVEEGDLLECTIKAVVPRDEDNHKPERLLVDVGGGVLVEVRRRQAAKILSQRLSQQYISGQTVAGRVTRIEPSKGIIEVSLKEGDAWDNANIKRGQPISGVIGSIRTSENGEKCFIEPDGWPGLFGIAALPTWGDFRKHMRVTCKVLNFVGDKHHLSLLIVRRLA